MGDDEERPVDVLGDLLLEMHWTMHNRRDLNGYEECHQLLHRIFAIAPRSSINALKALLAEGNK